MSWERISANIRLRYPVWFCICICVYACICICVCVHACIAMADSCRSRQLWWIATWPPHMQCRYMQSAKCKIGQERLERSKRKAKVVDKLCFDSPCAEKSYLSINNKYFLRPPVLSSYFTGTGILCTWNWMLQLYWRLIGTRSSWFNCALQGDEADNWYYWVSRGHLCLYIH